MYFCFWFCFCFLKNPPEVCHYSIKPYLEGRVLKFLRLYTLPEPGGWSCRRSTVSPPSFYIFHEISLSLPEPFSFYSLCVTWGGGGTRGNKNKRAPTNVNSVHHDGDFPRQNQTKVKTKHEIRYNLVSWHRDYKQIIRLLVIVSTYTYTGGIIKNV